MMPETERYLNRLHVLWQSHRFLDGQLTASLRQSERARIYAAKPGANAQLAKATLDRCKSRRLDLVSRLEAVRREAESIHELQPCPIAGFDE